MDAVQRTLNITLLEESEADVCGLAFALLGEGHKDYRYGYIVRAEHHLGAGDVADVTIEVLRGDDKVLVVECKRSYQGFQRGQLQIKGYMINGRFPNGLLICGQTSRFFSYNPADDDAVPTKDGQYSNPWELTDVIACIRAM
ncbi:hypothetical protein GGI11_003796 [Coemansia sp. RSA 2049]|nr:hypothetical protein GGI11_003796 [Coemansia sp. RSA 2049]KAJ2518730.1 hypothetical protein H4217_003148 [Coemansia sp. RSA 1939]KAJ2614186.1 hypothetical protein EV177_002179 [Coemansia sp. RSA 1804]KAJ2687637.1 hypothetical protein GGH99_003214 [Coemansia sp. RSA 1285]